MWRYDRAPLVIAYSLGVGATVITLVLGGLALHSNEQVHDMSFSAVLRTTHTPALDAAVEGTEDGALPETKLRLVRGQAKVNTVRCLGTLLPRGQHRK